MRWIMLLIALMISFGAFADMLLVGAGSPPTTGSSNIYACYPRIATTVGTPSDDFVSSDITALDASLAALPGSCTKTYPMWNGINSPDLTNGATNTSMKSARMKYIRSGIEWEHNCNSDGSIDTTDGDYTGSLAFIAKANSNGFIPHIVISSGGINPPGIGAYDGVNGTNTAHAYAVFATYAANLVSGYANNTYFELWNEVELGKFTRIFGDGVDTEYNQGLNYAHMLKLAVPAMKAVRSSIKIILGGLSDPDHMDFINGIYDGGGGPYIDIWNIHIYGTIEDRLVGFGTMVRQAMEFHGDTYKPLWCTEWGNISGGSTQATAITNFVQRNYTYGICDVLEVYAYNDDGWSMFPNQPSSNNPSQAMQWMMTNAAAYFH